MRIEASRNETDSSDEAAAARRMRDRAPRASAFVLPGAAPPLASEPRALAPRNIPAPQRAMPKLVTLPPPNPRPAAPPRMQPSDWVGPTVPHRATPGGAPISASASGAAALTLKHEERRVTPLPTDGTAPPAHERSAGRDLRRDASPRAAPDRATRQPEPARGERDRLERGEPALLPPPVIRVELGGPPIGSTEPGVARGGATSLVEQIVAFVERTQQCGARSGVELALNLGPGMAGRLSVVALAPGAIALRAGGWGNSSAWLRGRIRTLIHALAQRAIRVREVTYDDAM